jgi:hypothetical protein
LLYRRAAVNPPAKAICLKLMRLPGERCSGEREIRFVSLDLRGVEFDGVMRDAKGRRGRDDQPLSKFRRRLVSLRTLDLTSSSFGAPSMSSVDDLVPDIRAFRPFLPAKEFQTSLQFYEAVGFKTYRLGDELAEMNLGPYAFLLQGYFVKAWAENMMMHVLVQDVGAWWRHLDALGLAERFGVSPPSAPRAEPWGLTITYLTDPAGVLWHFAQATEPQG